MKYIIILGDGMADRPIPELGGKTPLQAARKPNMDYVARQGRNGMLHTIPRGFAPGSEIANLSLLGYDVAKVFEGRGPLEAAGMDIAIDDDEIAMRCNLITVEAGRIVNHSAGHISTEEAHRLIGFMQKELGGGDVNFFPGVSYRNLLKIRGGDKRIVSTPPHDVPGVPFRSVMNGAQTPEAAPTANLLNSLILRSQEILPGHPVNVERRARGLAQANSIWPWSAGRRPAMEKLTDKYGIRSGVVITAVDLIKGIGVYAGLKYVGVEGATGRYDTNYEGKATAAIEALRGNDFVFLHVEASDEAGHEGDYDLKIKTIEYLDSRIIQPILEAIPSFSEPVAITILPDHPTPCALRTHTSDPVPFTVWMPGREPDSVECFDEFAAQDGALDVMSGVGLMNILFRNNR